MAPSLLSISAEIASVDFDETMSFRLRNEYFLANEGNERLLIKILIGEQERQFY